MTSGSDLPRDSGLGVAERGGGRGAAVAARKRAQAPPDWDEMERILGPGKARNLERGKAADPVLADVERLVSELKNDERRTGR